MVTVPGAHFIQEDSPHEIGQAVAVFVQRIAEPHATPNALPTDLAAASRSRR